MSIPPQFTPRAPPDSSSTDTDTTEVPPNTDGSTSTASTTVGMYKSEY